MAEQFKYRRAPATPRRISEINPEKDIRVRLLGRVIVKDNGTLIIDDGTGKAEIIVENQDADINDLVRVFTRVLPLEEGFELRAELIQKMNGLDIDLYKKIVEK
ncbi:MAG: hypothetical protein HYT72_04075 [Candidatus Aenigmarchaeota archaeon]|nr:hypothetical protein [Candidatus Aenigmarchaeota archaeon]